MNWLFEILFTDDDWREIELCCMRNGASRPKVIRLTGPCLPGIN